MPITWIFAFVTLIMAIVGSTRSNKFFYDEDDDTKFFTVNKSAKSIGNRFLTWSVNGGFMFVAWI